MVHPQKRKSVKHNCLVCVCTVVHFFVVLKMCVCMCVCVCYVCTAEELARIHSIRSLLNLKLQTIPDDPSANDEEIKIPDRRRSSNARKDCRVDGITSAGGKRNVWA